MQVQEHLPHQWAPLQLTGYFGYTLNAPLYISMVKDLVFKTYGKCSKISNTLKLRTPKIIDENNF